MANKPFSIQAPEEIAKEYGGNKQKIAQGMQAGLIDPTAGVLAGMFIDRMRSAQMQEMQPSPTVAQQVMGGAPAAPVGPPAAGGLGALPPPAPSMTPPMGPPGAPPMPPGMADGGYLPPYASGGLSDLPVPDAMFDEPGNGGYGGGGIVAFSGGNPGMMKPSTGFDEYGMPTTYASAQQWYNQQIGAEPTKYTDMMEAYYAKRMDPATIAKERERSEGLAGLQIAAALLASKSPTFGGAVGEAGEKAVPLFASMEAQRKLEEKQNIDALAGIEGQRYDRKGRRVESQLSILGQAISRREAEKSREQVERLAREKINAMREAALARASGASPRGPKLTAGERAANVEAERIIRGSVNPDVKHEGALYSAYARAFAQYQKNPTEATKANVIAMLLPIKAYANKLVANYAKTPGGMSFFGQPGEDDQGGGAAAEEVDLGSFLD